MAIFNHRLIIAGAVGTRFESVHAFTDAPAVIAAFDNQVYFLPFVLADVAAPQVAGFAVPTESPGVAQAVGPDFLANSVLVKLRFGVEWIVGGARVSERFFDVGDHLRRVVAGINAQNLAEQQGSVLTIVKWIVAPAAITQANIEEP